MTTHIERLKISAEQKVGRQMHTPKDFEYLRECIYEDCHEMVSLSTLRRLWGYDRYEGTPRISSLNPIARYVVTGMISSCINLTTKSRTVWTNPPLQYRKRYRKDRIGKPASICSEFFLP